MVNAEASSRSSPSSADQDDSSDHSRVSTLRSSTRTKKQGGGANKSFEPYRIPSAKMRNKKNSEGDQKELQFSLTEPGGAIDQKDELEAMQKIVA
jgi:hypothetical protein